MLWAIVILLVFLLLATWEGLGELRSINAASLSIAHVAEQWERSQRVPSWPEPQPTPTKEEIEQQKLDELEKQKRAQLRQQEGDERLQGFLREQAEREGSGWQTGRIISHRMTDADDYEVVLSTADRTYTARGHLGTFYREGESHVAQPLQLGTEIRYALPGTIGVGLGQLLAENPGGRILGFRLTEEQVTVIAPSEPSVPTERILVVDDDESLRDIIVSMLTSAGYQCRAVAGGLEALALLESGEKFELLTTDLLNSPMDGLSLLQRVKQKFPYIPVVVASAVRDDAVADECVRSGACEYLFLPFEREQLLATVNRALKHRRPRLENHK